MCAGIISAPAANSDVGGQGDYLHFSHANGYPPAAYRALIGQLTESHQLITSVHRPLWQPTPAPDSVKSWRVFADDVLDLLQAHSAPVFSVGHSMGATAIVLAAVREPHLFRGLVLIEPVLVPRRYLMLLRFFARFAPRQVPMIRTTLQRQQRWSNRQEAFAHYRPKGVFRRIPDEVLWDYVKYCLVDESDGSVSLQYSREWEAHCYKLVHNLWRVLPRLRIPVLGIRGADTTTLSAASWQRWQALSPQHDYIEMAGAGHLLPFEQAEPLAAHIKNWMAAQRRD